MEITEEECELYNKMASRNGYIIESCKAIISTIHLGDGKTVETVHRKEITFPCLYGVMNSITKIRELTYPEAIWRVYKKDGIIYRDDDLPAVESLDGTCKEWYINGLFHRTIPDILNGAYKCVNDTK